MNSTKQIKCNTMEIKRNFLKDFPSFSELEKCIECGEEMFSKYDPCKYLSFINEQHDDPKKVSGEIYDFLISWGMKLEKQNVAYRKDLFVQQIDQMKECISNIKDFSLENFKANEDKIRKNLEIFWTIDITGRNSKIVFHTKALHFFLPKLFIPMDRHYTLCYLNDFHDSYYFLKKHETLGDDLEICIAYHRYMADLYKTYQEKLTQLQTKSCPSKNYPITKLLDHAVIGFVRKGKNKCGK